MGAPESFSLLYFYCHFILHIPVVILFFWLIRNMGKFLNPESYLTLNGSQLFNSYSCDSAKQQNCEFSYLCVCFLQEEIE